MIIKTWDELREADGRTLHFTPHGLGLGVKMTPESSAEFQQTNVAALELAPAVAKGTRQSFDRLRTVFAYGVLCYDIFTLVSDHALLVIEQALRDRFIDFHEGKVTFVDAAGAPHEVAIERYEQVHDFIESQKKQRRSKTGVKEKPWRLRVGAGPEAIDFNGTLHGLKTWARTAGLLRGQRNRGIEQALSTLRNYVAHPTSYHLLGPVEATRMLSDLCEIINHLWGCNTPGGRLYPAPLRRSVAAIAWSKEHGISVTAVENLRDESEFDEFWEFSIIRAVFEFGSRITDPALAQFDSLHEATWYPVDLLWGPGSRQDGIAWLDANDPQPDEFDYLDRVFAIRHNNGELYLPMRPSIAAALPIDEQAGRWFAVRSDLPTAAFSHIRKYLSGTSKCSGRGPCSQCHAETLTSGTYAEIMRASGARIGIPLPPDVRTPFADRRSWPA
ncbi:hypothetical protein QMK19_14290 [Streptomyces sp. H10-C2]|uniref:hypothetical protein n=1 Tax=unclassified Streptomyces TaxID=2593676 RepID=UPI0024BA34D7|nr:MULTISPECIES: hypothetical protein [unclassified Streptomyces]MDJ0345041.1 hypothetical protein [Streptomyces sp. PH10-H1]MDJ0370818.1 hypothetical protein [Streptomyces sp. H10-C2]